MTKPYLFPTLPHLLSLPDRPFIHRDLSGFQFNERVLAEARSSANPLLERAKFLSITASNLDEFFMIRYASLDRSIRAAGTRNARHRLHLARTRDSLLDTARAFCAKQEETLDLISSALEGKNIRLPRSSAEDAETKAVGKEIFDRDVLPHLSPPEPFTLQRLHQLANLKIGVLFPSQLWFRISRQLPGTFAAADGKRHYIFFLDDLLFRHLGAAFRLEGAPGLVRLTRDGDIPIEVDQEDLSAIPDMIRSGLGSRDRGRPVRLQYAGDIDMNVLNRCMAALRLSPRQVLPAPGTLYLQSLWSAVNKLPADSQNDRALSLPPLAPFIVAPLRRPGPMFEELKKRDVLLHHPYESFDAYVNFIQAACEDPAVTMIQQTVYRTDALSPVVDALKGAAKKKKIRVLIELRARFDEMNNLRLADEFRKAGVEVAFGFAKLKLHAKVALVTRKEGDGETLYTHLSTGNYNASTARAYEDLAILTARPEPGEDARTFFDAVFRGEVPTAFKTLVPAPAKLHRLMVQLIEEETKAAKAGRPAYLFAKVNALVDEEIVESLYDASRAGVKVDLMVRGACALIPGVKGLSENVRVVSLVDRFLEHSRIYYFADVNKMYLSSADWMPRNFFSRLELAFPVLDPRLYAFIKDVVIPVYLADTVRCRELTPQGTWKKRSLADTQTARFKQTSPQFAGQSIRAQMYFEELARKTYQGTPLSHAYQELAKK